MFSKEIFSGRLLCLRKQNNTTQSDLASIIGLSRTAITRMECGDRAPSVEVLCTIADYFDVSLDYLVGRTDNPDSHKR